MTGTQDPASRLARSAYDTQLSADVLVIGGGPAGAWAALAAAETGASVIVAEKGYTGTAGPLSSANTGIYYIKPDDPIHRNGMVTARMPLAFGLADERWLERTLDQSYANLEAMARWGYKWPKNEAGQEYRARLRGPDTLIFLRRQLLKSRVRLLDHSPAMELLVSGGVAAGAAGVNRQTGDTWSVRAGAVVLATGGTAFLSGVAGTRGNTGDGYLFAAEAGAEFSGMEFSSQYAPAPHGGVLSRGAHLEYATLFDNAGNEITRGRRTVEAIEQTGAAWAILDKAKDEATRAMLRRTHAHIFLHLDRLGIDPFTERYRIDFRLEGTIRGVGGLAIDDDLATTVPGLFAAGDITTKEQVVGAGPPGGGPAASWAIASGSWSGAAAARFAKRLGPAANTRNVRAVGGTGLHAAQARKSGISIADVTASVQAEMLPFDRNYWRSGVHLEASLERFAGEWAEIRDGSLTTGAAGTPRDAARELLRAREAAAMLATARFINVSALARTETRGLHRRSDFPDLDPGQGHHLISGGLDRVWVHCRPLGAREKALAS
jgi:succinate dehydrogenase/fumarate reductase flavoprotein subunit